MRGCVGFFLCVFSITAAAATFSGDDGTRVALDTPPKRIISIAPNLTELAYAAGLGSRMVAVTAYSDYPDAAKKLPQVGDAFRLDWERLAAMKPDLVLAWKSSLSARDRDVFARLKIKVLVLEPRRLDDIPRTLRLLGQIGGTTEQAESAAQDFERQRDALRDRYAARPPVRVWFLIAVNPFLTVSDEHIIGDVLHVCGAENVFADAPALIPAVSAEAVVRAQPELILASADSPEQRYAMQESWQGLPLAAAKQNRAAFIPPDLISRASPRILQGAKMICETVEKNR